MRHLIRGASDTFLVDGLWLEEKPIFSNNTGNEIFRLPADGTGEVLGDSSGVEKFEECEESTL